MQSKESNSKTYGYLFLSGVIIVLALRIAALIISHGMLSQLSRNEQIDADDMQTISNITGALEFQARWLGYLFAAFWSVFWIDKKVTAVAYYAGIILFWAIQYGILRLLLLLSPAYMHISNAATQVMNDVILGPYMEMILLGSTLYKIYRIRNHKLD